MRKCLASAFILLLLFTLSAQAQHYALRHQIKQIAAEAHGKVGVAISLLEADDTLTYHNQYRYVLQSVAKLAIAFTALREVDKGHLRLDQIVHITQADFLKTYSPLHELHLNGDADVPLQTVINFMVAQSDNAACDILLKLLGGPRPVENLVHNMGISAFSLKASEAQMAASWAVQYSNWCQPFSQIELLRIIFRNTLLSPESNTYLTRILLASSPGTLRLKGLLPAGTPVAHKTGTSNTNDSGLTAATNDVGIITLPNGKHLAVAVFIADSTDPLAKRELTIAKIAKAAYDEFVK